MNTTFINVYFGSQPITQCSLMAIDLWSFIPRTGFGQEGGYVAWDTGYMYLSSYTESEVRVQAIPPVHNLWAK